VETAPNVKICGVARREDAARAADLGAWAVGMIFHRPSPRRCSVAEAEAIAAALRRRVELCGVFVNATLDRVAQTADRVGLTMLQLHGDEGPAYCAEAARRTGCRVIKAVPVRSRGDLARLEPFHTDFHMLDGFAPGLRGGTGQAFDWSLAGARPTDVPMILSGGLTPENVADGITATRPFAVDVASGVEAEPGRKDHGRMEAFFAAVRGREPALQARP
jgi:phosphoribosylanthranilate isomerase